MSPASAMKTISILTPCFNEEGNVREVYERVRAEMLKLGTYGYEHVFIDNNSADNTLGELKAIASLDRNVKIIANARNFGHIRSPMHGFLQTRGDAVIGIVADLQDPPDLIPAMISRWEEGYAMVLCIKRTSEENRLMFWIRKKYYASDPAAVVDRYVRELHGLRPLRSQGGGGSASLRRSVSVLQGHDCRNRAPTLRDPLRPAAPQAWGHEEPFLLALRHGHARASRTYPRCHYDS